MAAKLVRARSPAAAAALLLAAACLVLAATVADARPLMREELPSSSVVVESPPAGGIQTVVGAAEHDGAGARKFAMSIDMLRGVKDSGPSPGAGH
ncbi:hypothetical protein GQ55_4G075000 [Panicum hallii var. hallii]|jgi:hypothetical protein|uniref:Dirigent protein n=2 Tax=Panicum hallii TaxID=206008 RepID=A0A2T7DW97_9POAL|nr:uncharacterized protein LOC112890863 [Panicum hallii]PAN23188.1 hypothetical protein PAHAL_4G073700 [Panicum hallii]PUZ59835.1 hypothetical protein GQ55_4G075000 [Panicum hallii var. hallii]